MSQINTIQFIITGGTIDSYYEGTKDSVVPNENSVIEKYIKSLKLFVPTIFTEVCMKDSRDITTQDQKKILYECETSPEKQIIITHGTYTMPDTARFLKANLKRKDQVIILTGSMIPLVGFSPSDGGFHLGFSIASIKTLQPGVYICMNGRIFSSDEAMKVSPEGRFNSIFSEN